MTEIKNYMRSLLQALNHVHKHNIIHRDIKPSNFLFHRKLQRGVLVDFGLAHFEQPKVPEKVAKDQLPHKIGYYANDPRPSIRASRSGTRGFRAPEVLFKVVNQTKAIDIWSAGVILLSLFSGVFPFFQSTDDQEAMAETAILFGSVKMKALGAKLRTLFNVDRTFDSNLPSITEQGIPFKKLLYHLRPLFKTDATSLEFLQGLLDLDPTTRLTAKQALEHPWFH